MVDMKEERLKVLEMVAQGKIAPEDGVRLLEALGETRSARAMRCRISACRRSIWASWARSSSSSKKRRWKGRARRTATSAAAGPGGCWSSRTSRSAWMCRRACSRCNLNLETRAGKLKVRGGEAEGKLLLGKIKHAPEEPEVFLEVREGVAELGVKHGMGRGSLRLNETLSYAFKVDNAAADTELELEELLVDDLEIDNNAGQVVVQLGGRAEHISVAIKNNAGNVTLKLPETHALKFARQRGAVQPQPGEVWPGRRWTT